MKIIIVSGSVCSGKTTLAKKISKEKKFEYVDVNKVIKKHKLGKKFDKKRKCKIVDNKKLSKILIDEVSDYKKRNFDKVLRRIKSKKLMLNKKNIKIVSKKLGIKKGMIIDSHLSHYLPKKYVDLCIITKCSDLKKLEKRLKKRKYSKVKVEENIECEIFDICLNEALERRHKVKIIDTCKKSKKKKRN